MSTNHGFRDEQQCGFRQAEKSSNAASEMSSNAASEMSSNAASEMSAYPQRPLLETRLNFVRETGGSWRSQQVVRGQRHHPVNKHPGGGEVARLTRIEKSTVVQFSQFFSHTARNMQPKNRRVPRQKKQFNSNTDRSRKLLPMQQHRGNTVVVGQPSCPARNPRRWVLGGPAL
jgi:hypothetical protein